MKIAVFAAGVAGAGGIAVLSVSLWYYLSPKTEGVFSQYGQRSTPTLAQINEKLVRQLLDEITACVQAKSGNLLTSGFDLTKIHSTAANCLFSVVLLDRDGRVRPNGEARLEAIVSFLGITVPPPQVSGQAVVKITPVPESRVFTVPVKVAGKSHQFLLDTGASSSILQETTAKGLGLQGLPVPSEILRYSVVGDDCDRIRATIINLPPLQVDQAKVAGLSGMGLNEIPADLAGVLGMDFLSAYNLYLHPQRGTMKLLPRTPPPEDKDLLPLVGKLGVMTILANINDKGNSPFLLDTGADVMVIAESEAVGLGIALTEAEPTEVLGFCGVESAKRVKLRSVQIGRHRLTNLEAVVIKGDILKLLGVKGIVGQNYLNRFEQYWYFGDRNALGYPTSGFLSLTPILP
jgi:clan AA aspartic protease (TIGR02281 family)